MINEAKFADELFAKGHTQYMSLQIFVDSEDLTLIHKYKDAIKKHNSDILAHDTFNSGFDLFSLVEHIEINPFTLTFDFKVACKTEIIHDNSKRHPCGFYLYPRSSIGKTAFRLANSVGIIDSSYRGNIKAMIDMNEFLPFFSKVMGYDSHTVTTNIQCHTKLNEDGNHIENYSRMFQLCAPNLMPVYVEMVAERELLGSTQRGMGGFGSSGV